jgi:IclR family transcriptional regulator, KDG regulon repressor
MSDYGESLSKYRLELVEKVIEVLTAFTPEHRELTLAELTARTQQSESSVYRIVANLTRLGFLVRDDETRKFSIGIRAYSVGSLALRSMKAVVRPRMEELCERYSLTVNLSVRDQLEVLIVDVVESNQSFRIASSVGTREPLHCTASGKCLVAFGSERVQGELLDAIEPLRRYSAKTLTTRDELSKELARIRRTVVALDRGEYQAHARCIAVPIFGSADTISAAVSVSGPRQLFSPAEALPIVAQLCALGENVSKALGALSPYPASCLREAPRWREVVGNAAA